VEGHSLTQNTERNELDFVAICMCDDGLVIDSCIVLHLRLHPHYLDQCLEFVCTNLQCKQLPDTCRTCRIDTTPSRCILTEHLVVQVSASSLCWSTSRARATWEGAQHATCTSWLMATSPPTVWHHCFR
jgi:hypothetical protein